MRRELLAVALVLATGASAQARTEGFNADDLDVGEPVIAHNIAVVPLYTKKAPPYDEYIVLEDAQSQKSVKISETPGEQVERLVVRNNDTDKRPLYLLGGEVVLGGKQDRMVVADTVIEAKTTRELEVRCVEQGRWQGADLAFHSSEAVAHPDLRKAALFKGQGDVWNEVARKSAASNVSSSTGTYRRVVQDEAVRAKIKSYLDELQQQIPHNEKLTGLAVAINGNLELVDIFDSPKLYAKLERKLLASYVLSALERQPGSIAKAKAYEKRAKSIGKSNVDTMLKGSTESIADDSDAQATKPRRSEAKSGPTGKVFTHKGKAVHGTYFGDEQQKENE
jgi:hypothetical protein